MGSTKKPEVLIVGAGPTGLMLACQLARLGVSFRIIDKSKEPTTQSRALVIQARSMEIFDQMGIAREFTRQGLRAKAINYVVNGKIAQNIPLSGYGKGLTAFPHLLVLEQSKTERILIAHLQKLGHKVERETEFADLKQSAEDVTATVRHASGKTETITANWLVGADGARSPVREHLGIPFGGKTYSHMLYVLDCKVSWNMPADEMYVAFSKDSFGAFFPMPGGRCRVAGILPERLEGKEEIAFDDVNKDFAERLRMDIKLSDPEWISLYHAHHRYAVNFQSGRCFLAGDAAHIHSPVGAQGMNTGLQDAYNLAWKLAFVIQGKAKKSLLKTYTDERLPIAKALVRTTDRAFSVTVNKNPLTRIGPMYLAPKLLPLVVKLPLFANLVFKGISEIGIAYRKSKLSRDASHGRFPRHAPKPGDRLLYVLVSDDGKNTNIQNKVNGMSFCLLIFGKSENAKELDEAAAGHKHLLKVHHVPRTTKNKDAYHAFGISRSGFYLVRPDMHIACRSSTLNAAYLRQYLRRVLV